MKYSSVRLHLTSTRRVKSLRCTVDILPLFYLFLRSIVAYDKDNRKSFDAIKDQPKSKKMHAYACLEARDLKIQYISNNESCATAFTGKTHTRHFVSRKYYFALTET